MPESPSLEAFLTARAEERRCRCAFGRVPPAEQDQVRRVIESRKSAGDPVPWSAIADWLTESGSPLKADTIKTHFARGHE